jgi:serine/threonine protein kinase
MNAPGPLPFPADGHAPAGHRLGNFELRGVASRSAHGIVYRAWDHELGIAVAVKEYFPQKLARRDGRGDVQPHGSVAIGAFERGRETFVNEARLLARCDHPSLVRVRQLLRMHGTVYRVMPWCQGWPLADLRREMVDPPDEPALRRLLLEVLGALEAWHRVGGPHGSVNPAKVLLLDDDRALLLGPGLARRASTGSLDAADAASATETPAPPFGRSFLAPEQLTPSAQAPCGPWTDFFALAHVVRYCITGMLPQPDSPPTEPLAATVESLYFDAPHVRYDADFLRTLDAAGSPVIGDRPQSVREFCDWLEQGPPQVPPAAPVAATPPSVAPLAQAAASGPAQAAAPAAVPDAASDAAPDAVPDAVPESAQDSPTEAAHRPVPPPAPLVGAEVDIPVEPDPQPSPGLAGNAPPAPAVATAKEEAVDDATVDLIRRVIEAIPERQEPPLEAAGHPAFAEPLLRVDEWTAAPSAPWEAHRKGTGHWWALGAVLLAAAVFAAWEWGWPALQGLDVAAVPDRPATVVRPAAPPVDATATSPAPAAVPVSAPVAEAPAASPVAAAPDASAAAASPEASAPGSVSSSTSASGSAPAPAATAAAPASAAAAAASAPASASPSETTVAKVVVATAPPKPPAPAKATERETPPARRTSPDSPRQACGSRQQFALYRCMQQQCAMASWSKHAQCVRFKAADRVE